jgi:hypothetical protein
MGFSPHQVGTMSLYQYAAVVEGWNQAHGGDGAAQAPSAEEFAMAKLMHGD